MMKGLRVLRKMQPHISISLFLFCIYALSTSGYYRSSMDVTACMVAQSVLQDGDFALTKEEIETHELRKGVDGNYYSYESLGTVLIPIPLMVVSYIFGVTSGHPLWRIMLLTNPILTALSAVIIFVIGCELKYSRKTSLLLSLIYGLGTMAWAHTRFLMPDPLASLVYLVTFLFLLRYKRTGQTRELLLTGVWAGVALHCRPDAFLFVLAICIGVVLLLRRELKEKDKSFSVIARKAVIFVLPIVVFLCIWGYYNYYRFGSVLETGYTVSVEEGAVGEGERFGALSYVKRFLNVGETVKGFLGMWVIPNRSIFFVNPVLIFWLFALKPFWRKYRFEMVVYGIAFVLYVFLYSNRGAQGFAGSAAWGQRYFLPMIGFMTLTLGLFVEKVFGSGRPKMKILIISVFLLSVCFQSIGISQTYQSYQIAYDQQYGSEKARLMLTMDPRYSLLFLNVKMLGSGTTDLMYHRFIQKGNIPSWAILALSLLVMGVLMSGYALFKGFRASPAEIAGRKPQGKKKRQKRHRSKST
jgi:hypothetical protein